MGCIAHCWLDRRLRNFAVKDLARLGNHESQRASSYDHSGGNGDYRSLKSGATLTLLDESGPGEIRHIWITMAAGEAYHLKKIILRMYWDGEPEPSVETPIGDFFGLGLGTYTVYQSTLLAVAPEKALNAYFPMPFARHGVITATNEGSQQITDFYLERRLGTAALASCGDGVFSCAVPAVHALQGMVQGKLLRQQFRRSA